MAGTRARRRSPQYQLGCQVDNLAAVLAGPGRLIWDCAALTWQPRPVWAHNIIVVNSFSQGCHRLVRGQSIGCFGVLGEARLHEKDWPRCCIGTIRRYRQSIRPSDRARHNIAEPTQASHDERALHWLTRACWSHPTGKQTTADPLPQPCPHLLPQSPSQFPTTATSTSPLPCCAPGGKDMRIMDERKSEAAAE